MWLMSDGPPVGGDVTRAESLLRFLSVDRLKTLLKTTVSGAAERVRDANVVQRVLNSELCTRVLASRPARAAFQLLGVRWLLRAHPRLAESESGLVDKEAPLEAVSALAQLGSRLWLRFRQFIGRFWLFSYLTGKAVTLCLSLATLPVAGLLYYFQDKLLYFPQYPLGSRSLTATPAKYNLQFDDLTLRTQDSVRLHAWFIKCNDAYQLAPTVLFFQGNAGNIAHRLDNAALLVTQAHCNVLMLSYRGYGLSEGSPSEEGLILDAQCALDHLLARSDIDPRQIFLFGRSLGGAVAIALATQRQSQLCGLLLENTYTSILDMIDVVHPLLRPFKLVVRDRWMSCERILNITIPTLFISGLRDKHVPPAHMTSLHALCGSATKRLVQIPSGTHNRTYTQPDYFVHLHAFLHPPQPDGEEGE
eukprot:gnl/Hemi2/25392_TR8547_c0_g1_i1.p1 gnl/Hemi2/25392_TR8547_c0_g1~~gnl/Hemi2/25392_TR8547_c0_g1_i1.p1  ORF type:complete len:483 (+),score=74.69 gnl/Hemi2/25392_TR8547_c0_g1_i1:193-1449(+)